MSAKDRVRRQLDGARHLTEGLMQSLKSPEEWTHQVHPRANHALWIMGHLAQTDNFVLSIIAPEKAQDKPQYADCFGMGSQPVDDITKYPPIEEVQAYFRERRATLLEVFEGMSEEDLAQPTPEGTPEFLPDFGATVELGIWHEGLHSGQLTVARRALGYDPLFGGAPAEASS